MELRRVNGNGLDSHDVELMGFTFLCMTTFLGSSFGGNLSVVSFMGYSYWLAAAVRNKQMHILNGNSPSAPFSLHVCNINGLQQAGRWEFITDHLYDFMAITETHATVLVQTGLEKKIGGSKYGIIWGHPVKDRSFSGVALAYKRSSAWAVRSVPFLEESCSRFFNDGRLLAVQLFRSSEKRSFIIYILYGISGARWETHKKTYVQSMVAAVHKDSQLRGSVAMVMCGDFNLEIDDFPRQAERLFLDRWLDSARWGPSGSCTDPTSLRGKGARIDLALVNTTASSSLVSYCLEDGVNVRDHKMIHLSLQSPLASQTWYMPKCVGMHGSYKTPSETYNPPSISTDENIHIALRKKDVDLAYKLWCRRAESYLLTIPMTNGGHEVKSLRGHTAFRKLCSYPPERDGCAEDVWSRQLARALRQTEALLAMQVWGHRADLTLRNLEKFLHRDAGKFSQSPGSFLQDSMTRNELQRLQIFLRLEYNFAQRQMKYGRIRAWKDRMQSSIRMSYKWVRGQRKVEPTPMTLKDQTVTVDRNRQLDAILEEWKPIFHKYKQQKEDVSSFMANFGPYMKVGSMTLNPLQGGDLVAAALSTKPSASSLDRWRPESLKSLAQWFPDLFHDLAIILNFVELSGQWPLAILEGYVALVPKDETLVNPSPTEYRPISVLSGVYRLWSRSRFEQLMTWQESWVLHTVYGCRRKRGAEQLALQIAMDLESPAFTEDSVAAGISYDFRKAFDLIPTDIMLATMEKRGVDPRISRSLRSLYNGLRRVFMLHGAAGSWWRSYNGIVQGDCLSMLALNSVVSCILEVRNTIPQSVSRISRSYADDISAVARGSSSEAVNDALRGFHSVVRAFVDAGGGELNLKKCFTFGDISAKGVLGPEVQHLDEFRIVGGAFVTRNEPCTFTLLEQKRWDKWKQSIRRIRHLPRPWIERARMMLATQSQAIFAAGIHGVGADPELVKVRSEIMRALWKADTYSMSPHITLSLLAPVQLDPTFGAMYESLRCILRGLRIPEIAGMVRERFFTTPRRAVDGPVSNLRFLADNTVLGRTIYGLFSGRRIDEGKFLHDLRDQWRGFLWRTVAVNRPQHYGGAESIDRPRTLRLYETLRSVADTEDLDECLGDDKSVQRQQLGVLRRIFAGGLMTPERYARHKRLPNDRLCACGGDKETIFHISWYCSRYSHIRMEVLDSFSNLGISLDSLPVCFTYAGIVPTDFFLSDELIERVHQMLISIWQEHIKNWHAGKDLGEVVSKARSERTMVGGLISENGHLLAPRDTGSGLWCRRCGKYVQRLEHVRLKITGQPCDHPNGPLLHSEGYSRSSVRLDALERELNLKYNRGRHMLLWNRKVGKVIGSSDEGFIRCLKCKRQWRWKDRVNNLLRTTCIVSQSVHFTKRIRNKSSLSHVQDNLTVSPLWRNEAQIDVLPPDRVGVG